MGEVITIGLDIAKQAFHAHGVDERGEVVFRRKLRRDEVTAFFARLPACLIGMEACASAHHWARTLMAQGHDVRLMPPGYVKPYVKRQKNDAADAEAICEAVTRPSMRFVPIKSPEQQGVLTLHRARELLIRQRTMLINALRGHLAEFGIIARQGGPGVAALVEAVDAPGPDSGVIPAVARMALSSLTAQLRDLSVRIAEVEREILAWHQGNAVSRRLATIPGVGPITASALAATIADARAFASGRHMAAWIGLVPRQSSTGGKARLGRITKKGDAYLRRLLVIGALAALRVSRRSTASSSRWAAALAERKPAKLVAIALANKMARIAWAVMTSGERFRPDPLAKPA